MDPHTQRLAEQFLARHIHDGVVLDLPRRPASPATIAFSTFGWLLVGAISLVTIAQPVAAFVEWMGWWLVNEPVLRFRWMAIGLPLWPLLALPVAALIRGPRRVRLTLDQHGLTWGRLLGRCRVAWSSLRAVQIKRGRIVITTRQDRRVRLPALEGPTSPDITRSDATADLVRAIDAQRHARIFGTSDEVPEEIRLLLGEAPSQPPPPPA